MKKIWECGIINNRRDGAVREPLRFLKGMDTFMLIYQPWVHFAPDMITEWEQCLDEGRDVASLKALCEEISRRGSAWDDVADQTAKQMKPSIM